MAEIKERLVRLVVCLFTVQVDLEDLFVDLKLKSVKVTTCFCATLTCQETSLSLLYDVPDGSGTQLHLDPMEMYTYKVLFA